MNQVDLHKLTLRHDASVVDELQAFCDCNGVTLNGYTQAASEYVTEEWNRQERKPVQDWPKSRGRTIRLAQIRRAREIDAERRRRDRLAH